MAPSSAPATANRRCPHFTHAASSPSAWQQGYKLCLAVPSMRGWIRSYSSIFLLLIAWLPLLSLPLLSSHRHPQHPQQSTRALIVSPRTPPTLETRRVWDPGIAALQATRAATTAVTCLSAGQLCNIRTRPVHVASRTAIYGFSTITDDATALR